MEVNDVAPSFLDHTYGSFSPLNHTFGDDPEPEEASEAHIVSNVRDDSSQLCAKSNSSALEAAKGHKGVALARHFTLPFRGEKWARIPLFSFTVSPFFLNGKH